MPITSSARFTSQREMSNRPRRRIVRGSRRPTAAVTPTRRKRNCLMVARAVKRFLKSPEWRKQHRWRKALWNTMSRMGLTGLHALPMNRRWVEIHWRKMPLKNLDPSMNGLKIVQISDIHYSPMVWRRYLVQHIEWINELRPDLVVVTGDLVTGGYRYSDKVAQLLAN